MKTEENKICHEISQEEMHKNEKGMETHCLGHDIIFKGTLLKENWYRNKQVRYCELFNNGELKYYDIDKKT